MGSPNHASMLAAVLALGGSITPYVGAPRMGRRPGGRAHPDKKAQRKRQREARRRNR